MKRRRLTFVPTFMDHDTRALLRFVPLDPSKGALPGFTHRVVIESESVGFLSDKFHPNAKAARFFLDKHRPIIEQGTSP